MPPTRRRPPPGAGGRPSAARRPGPGRRRPPRPPVRWSTRIAGGLALLVITASGLGHAVVDSLSGAIDRVDAFGGMQGRPDGTKGSNFLLVGTDGRDGLDPAQKQQYHLGGAPCHCTDTIMLVHLSADRQRATIVSIPRDSYVRLPEPAGAAAQTASPAAASAVAASPTASASPAAPASPSASPSASPTASALAAVPASVTRSVSASAAVPSGTSSGAPPGTPLGAPDASGSAGAPAPATAPASASAAASGSGSGSAALPATATRPAKINEAYADGGPKLTVRTVEQLTGVHIDHYLEVDFTSFMKTVDVIGGVKVCSTEPLTDSYTGLDLPAGTTTLDGGQALQYVRSRHIDGSADLGRMQRQQRFLAQVIHKMTSGGTLGDPVALGKVATTVLGSVRADQGLDATDLIALAQGMKGFSPSSSEFVSVPLSDLDYRVPGVGSTVKWDDKKAGRLWAAIRADRPLTAPRPRSAHGATRVEVDPAQIRVVLRNGTSTNGLAATAQKALRATGFATPGLPRTAPRKVPRTEIRFDPRWDRSVRSLAAALPGAELVPVAGQGAVMDVTLGADFSRVAPVTVAPHAVGEDAVTGDEVVCP